MWSSSSLPASCKVACLFCILLSLLGSWSAFAQDKKVTLFCPDIPRKEAILTVAFQAEKDVVFLSDVPGNITLRRESIPFEEALDLILEGTGILWHKKGDTYYIGTPKEGTPEYMALSDVEAYHSQFRTAQEILALHPEFVGKVLPVSPFRFLIAGPEKIRESIKKTIEALDHPKDHILIEATLLGTQEASARDLGFSFPDTQPLLLSPYPERGERLLGTLHAEERGEPTTYRALQKILVLDGEWGESWIGQRVYYKVEEDTARILKVVELGTGMKARPVYLGDGRIRIDLEVTVANATESDPPTITRRTFSASLVLEEGVATCVTLVEGKREVVRARKLFESRTENAQAPEKTEGESLVLFLRAKRERLENLPSLTYLEGPPILIEGKAWKSTQDTRVVLEYRTPGFLGIGFAVSCTDTTSITGNFYKELEGATLFGNLELSFSVEKYGFLKARWEWTEKAQGFLLFLESQKNGYFFRIGGGSTGSHTMSFVALGGEYHEGAFSLKGALTYQMAEEATNLRLDLEGQWEVRRNVFFVAGYSGILSGERTSFDDLRFDGFFVGLRVTF